MQKKKLKLKWVTDIIGDDYKTWKKGDIVIMQSQTGAGKTQFITNILVPSTKGKVLYVCNRTYLMRAVKKDLLRLNNLPIPKTTKELDDIKQIKNVTVISYQAIQHMKDFNTSKYKYIILDECHYIAAEATFNNRCDISNDRLIEADMPYTTRIFISATMENIRRSIVKSVEDSSKAKGKIYDYTTGTDYSYLDITYYKKLNDIITIIKNDTSDEKWLVFVSNKKDLEHVKESLGADICESVRAGTDNDEIENIIKENKFNKKVLVSTKALDNGINIHDDKLTNIVIMAWDRVSFIQMLGRKRINIEEAQSVNLYIPMRFKKSFVAKFNGLEKHFNEVMLLKDSPKEFEKKYSRDFPKLSELNYLIYLEERQFKINYEGFKALLREMDLVEMMIRAFATDKYAFIKEQLRWLNLEDTFTENTLVTDVYNDNDIVILSQKLKYAYEEGKMFLKDEFRTYISDGTNIDDILKKLDGGKSRAKGIGVYNKMFANFVLPYQVKSKQVKIDRNRVTKWYIVSEK